MGNSIAKRQFSLGTRDSQSTEALFLEQCYRFLKPGGWLAIILPDGLLANASTQNVRDWIEEHYRIVSIISLPQEAFKATNAGVKSSILIAQKLNERDTKHIQDLKEKIRNRIWMNGRYENQIQELEGERKMILNSWLGFPPENINWESESNSLILEEREIPSKPYDRKSKLVIEKTLEFKSWKSDC